MDDAHFVDSHGYECHEWGVANNMPCDSEELGYSEEEKAKIQSACPRACGLCPERPGEHANCEDSAGFRDSQGHACDEWGPTLELPCNKATAMEEGYSHVELEVIKAKCPKSCGLCAKLPNTQKDAANQTGKESKAEDEATGGAAAENATVENATVEDATAADATAARSLHAVRRGAVSEAFRARLEDHTTAMHEALETHMQGLEEAEAARAADAATGSALTAPRAIDAARRQTSSVANASEEQVERSKREAARRKVEEYRAAQKLAREQKAARAEAADNLLVAESVAAAESESQSDVTVHSDAAVHLLRSIAAAPPSVMAAAVAAVMLSLVRM